MLCYHLRYSFGNLFFTTSGLWDAVEYGGATLTDSFCSSYIEYVMAMFLEATGLC